MQRLFALALAICIWLGMAAPAAASISGDNVSGLVPCAESAAFQQRAATARDERAKARFEFYANTSLLCGEDGLPHLVVDGDLAHLGEFVIPGLMFLYIAGWIGWTGRSYQVANAESDNREEREILIDMELATKCAYEAFGWPWAAFLEVQSGNLTADKDEVTVSPR